MPDQSRSARAYLSAVAEPPCPRLAQFVDEVGPVEAAARLREGTAPEQAAAETRPHAVRDTDPDALLDSAHRAGMRILCPEDEDWPHAAFPAPAKHASTPPVPPLALWACGPLSPATLPERAVCVTGSHAATDYGQTVAADISRNLARHGVTIVSRGSYGIDAAAQHAVLAERGAAVMVTASGLDAPHPEPLRHLFQAVRARGLLLSEHPPGTRPSRPRHLACSRLLAALSGAVLIVEAGLRSHSRFIATTGFALGRPVLAVPGPVTSTASTGCHDLLRAGTAALATNAGDVLAALPRNTP